VPMGPQPKMPFAAQKLNGPEGPKAHSSQHPLRCQNRHWAAEVSKVRGGTAKDTLGGDHRSNTILYLLTDRQPM